VLLLGVIVFGTLGYRYLEAYPWLDALYMTVITISTVGFQELRPLSTAGRLFTMVLLFAGLGVVLYTAGAITRQIIEGEIRQFFGRRRMERQIASLRDHYVVCGFGRIGEAICEELASGPVPFVVVEGDADRARKAQGAKYLVVEGDATEDSILHAAGVPRAKALFASLPTDAANVFVTLTAKEINPALHVVARAETRRSERTLIHAGADKVVYPYLIVGHRMAQAALRPAVLDIVDLATHSQSLELRLEEIGVPASSRLPDTTMGDARFEERFGVIVAAVKRASGKMLFNPGAEEKFEAGDSLVILGEPTGLRALDQWLRA
jgi:voltage-gated potassium channel